MKPHSMAAYYQAEFISTDYKLAALLKRNQ